MSAPFTPGPWPIKRGGFGALVVGPAVLMHPGNERVEFALERGHDLLAERDDVARLIAAAPDMLAILSDITTWWDSYDADGPVPMDQIIQRARAIIARVEGGAA